MAAVRCFGVALGQPRPERDRPGFGPQVAGSREGQQVVRALDTAAAGPGRSQITDAIKVYERDVLHDVTWHP